MLYLQSIWVFAAVNSVTVHYIAIHEEKPKPHVMCSWLLYDLHMYVKPRLCTKWVDDDFLYHMSKIPNSENKSAPLSWLPILFKIWLACWNCLIFRLVLSIQGRVWLYLGRILIACVLYCKHMGNPKLSPMSAIAGPKSYNTMTTNRSDSFDWIKTNGRDAKRFHWNMSSISEPCLHTVSKVLQDNLVYFESDKMLHRYRNRAMRIHVSCIEICECAVSSHVSALSIQKFVGYETLMMIIHVIMWYNLCWRPHSTLGSDNFQRQLPFSYAARYRSGFCSISRKK